MSWLELAQLECRGATSGWVWGAERALPRPCLSHHHQISPCLCCRLVQFAFFAGMVVLATAFVWLCVPETKGVPLEEM